MKKVFVLISDENYLEHAKSLFYAAKSIGNWDGDLCLIANNVDNNLLEDFLKFDVKILNKKIDNFYFANFFIFDTFFKKWDLLMYMDCDFTIFSDLNKILDEDMIESNSINVDKEPFKIRDYFCQGWNYIEKTNGLIELEKKYDLDKIGFNAGFISFNTKIIKDTTLDELITLSQECNNINNHSSIGSDQPIFNLYFIDNVNHIKDNKVCFWRATDNKTIAQHHCHGEAPWKNETYCNILKKSYLENYKNNLNSFYDCIRK